MPHPIVHAEIRSTDPDATRKFFADLLGWTYPDPGAVPGYTFVDTGVPGALYTAIGPLQGGSDLVTFFIAVDDIDSAVKRVGELGGQVVQEPQHVPGVRIIHHDSMRLRHVELGTIRGDRHLVHPIECGGACNREAKEGCRAELPRRGVIGKDVDGAAVALWAIAPYIDAIASRMDETRDPKRAG